MAMPTSKRPPLDTTWRIAENDTCKHMKCDVLWEYTCVKLRPILALCTCCDSKQRFGIFAAFVVHRVYNQREYIKSCQYQYSNIYLVLHHHPNMGLWVLYVRIYLLWWKYHSHKPGTGVGFCTDKNAGLYVKWSSVLILNHNRLCIYLYICGLTLKLKKVHSLIMNTILNV